MIIDELIKMGVITKECRKLPLISEKRTKGKMKCTRPLALTKYEADMVLSDYINRNMDVKELSQTYGVSIPTIKKALRGGYSA